jgi:hypothetical protein
VHAASVATMITSRVVNQQHCGGVLNMPIEFRSLIVEGMEKHKTK